MVEEGEREEVPLESSAARLLGQGAADPGQTRPAVQTVEENAIMNQHSYTFQPIDSMTFPYL